MNTFIIGLLMKEPSERLGATGALAVKSHAWFAGISFFDLLDKKIRFKEGLEQFTPETYPARHILGNSQTLPSRNPFEEY